MAVIILDSDISLWPQNVQDALHRNRKVFDAWEYRISDTTNYSVDFDLVKKYEEAIKELDESLQEHRLLGWHCTRLTSLEIKNIIRDGLTPQSQESLHARIDQQKFSSEVSSYLKSNNLADIKNRVGMIWFCFFHPYKDGNGIEKFLRFWGGEALYTHNPLPSEIKKAISSIGIPCVIETEVPISSFRSSSDFAIDIAEIPYKKELLHREGYSIKSISPVHIRRVIQFPSADFFELTHADRWKKSL